MQFWYKKPSNVNEVVDSFGGYTPSQPSQKHPFHPITPPRVDNKNQPWYGSNTRWWGKGPDDTQFVDNAVTKTDGEDRYQIKSVWDYLDTWFGGNTPKSNLADQSGVPGMPQDGVPGMPKGMWFGGGKYNMMDQSGFVQPWDGDNQ